MLMAISPGWGEHPRASRRPGSCYWGGGLLRYARKSSNKRALHLTSFSICLQELSAEQVDHTHGWACVPLITTLSDEHHEIQILTDKSAINYCVVYCLSSSVITAEKRKSCIVIRLKLQVNASEWILKGIIQIIYSPSCPSKNIWLFFFFCGT